MNKGTTDGRIHARLHRGVGKLALTIGCTAGLPAGASAQQVATPPPSPAAEGQALSQPAAQAAPADTGGLEEIVVTAQRVEQKLQDVPIAVTAVAGSRLAASGITNLTEMTAQVPNLTVSRNLGIVNLFIRGVGNTFLNLGGDSSVALHEDGVFIGRPRSQVTAFIDVDRIEVLRGPQGTLYGRNATGGSINVITRKPTDHFSANGSLSAGNYGQVHFEGGVGGPIVDDLLSVRAAAIFTRRNGFGHNIQTGNDIDNLHEFGGRLSARITPAADFDYLVTADYYRANDEANPFHYFGPGKAGTIPLGLRLGGTAPSDVRDISSEIDPTRFAKVYGFAGFGTWRLGDGLSLKSTTAYRNSNTYLSSDADGTNRALVRIDQTELAHQFSQELQGTYTSDGITAIGGLYYFDEHISGSTLLRLPLVSPTAVGGSGPAKGEVKAYAAYGQLAFKLTDRLTLTAALRYSHEHRNSSGTAASVPLPDRAKSWSSTTPRFVVDYKITDGVLVYASASKGFKSGTILIGNPNAPVNPETLWAYEVGLKSQFLDRRVQINLAGFYYDYKDLQVSRTVGATTITENAATARLKGIEAEVSVVPWRGARIDATGTYLDTEFRSFSSADSPRPQLGAINLAGNRLPYAPEWTASLRGKQNIPLGDTAKLQLSGDITYSTRVYYDAFNLPERSQASYAMVNGRLGYMPNSEHWSIGVWVRNATNKLVKTSVIAGAPPAGFPLVGSVNEPRTFGGTVGFKL